MEAQTLIYNWNILLLSPLYLGKTYPEKHLHYNIRSLGQKIVDFFVEGFLRLCRIANYFVRKQPFCKYCVQSQYLFEGRNKKQEEQTESY